MGQLPAGGTIRTKDTEYGKEHDLYPRQNFAAVDFVCAAGAVCPVFAGYVRRGGPVDCGQVCSIGGCFGGIHRLADHDDADKPGQQLCHGHHDLLGQQIGCGERKKGGRTVGTAMRPILRRK